MEIRVSAIDKAGRTVDFLLTAKRDRKSASRFYSHRATRRDLVELGSPEVIRAPAEAAIATLRSANTADALEAAVEELRDAAAPG